MFITIEIAENADELLEIQKQLNAIYDYCWIDLSDDEAKALSDAISLIRKLQENAGQYATVRRAQEKSE